MYLYAEHQNGKKIGHKRIDRMDTATTRAFLEQKLGGPVLSPLERAGGSTISVIVVYGSRTPDGLARMTPLEQWAQC